MGQPIGVVHAQGTLMIKSTTTEASSLILALYEIVKTSIEKNKDVKSQNNEIISRIPEVKEKLDLIISNHCVNG